MKKRTTTPVLYKGFVVKVHQVGVYSAKKDGVTINANSKAELHAKIDALS